MNKLFSQELKAPEHTGIEDTLTPIQSSVVADIRKASDCFWNVHGDLYAMFEDSELLADNVKQARDILYGCCAKTKSLPKEVVAILNLCRKNCDAVLEANSEGKNTGGMRETIVTTDLLLRGTANALEKGNLDEYIKTLSRPIPYILLANERLLEADQFLQEIMVSLPGEITTFTANFLCDNDDYVNFYLLQDIDTADMEPGEYSPIDGVVKLTWMIKTILNDDMFMDDYAKEEAIYLITEAMQSLLNAVKAAHSHDASLSTPVLGILPLTFYSFDYIDEQCRKAAAA